MKIAVCDDEQQQRAILKNLLQQSCYYSPDMEICEFASGNEMVQSMKDAQAHYDIALLDISMDSGGPNGIETARIIRKYSPSVHILFVTSFMDYIFQAFEVKAFRYLIKPVAQHRFDADFKSALDECSDSQDKNYIISANQRILCIKISEILYLESNLRKITIYTEQGTHTFYGKFAEQENKLSNRGFVTVSKGLLVNLETIQLIDKTVIHLKGGKTLPVSRNRRKQIYDRFTHYLMENSI